LFFLALECLRFGFAIVLFASTYRSGIFIRRRRPLNVVPAQHISLEIGQSGKARVNLLRRASALYSVSVSTASRAQTLATSPAQRLQRQQKMALLTDQIGQIQLPLDGRDAGGVIGMHLPLSALDRAGCRADEELEISGD